MALGSSDCHQCHPIRLYLARMLWVQHSGRVKEQPNPNPN